MTGFDLQGQIETGGKKLDVKTQRLECKITILKFTLFPITAKLKSVKTEKLNNFILKFFLFNLFKIGLRSYLFFMLLTFNEHSL